MLASPDISRSQKSVPNIGRSLLNTINHHNYIFYAEPKQRHIDCPDRPYRNVQFAFHAPSLPTSHSAAKLPITVWNPPLAHVTPAPITFGQNAQSPSPSGTSTPTAAFSPIKSANNEYTGPVLHACACDTNPSASP